ncbi:MAG: hypothetical protein M3R15_05790 [Acidobacteriota bacterium]|nr:hypothetical protein [Acidobacteriota bacterium]
MFRRRVRPLNAVFSFRDGKRYDDAAEFHRIISSESDLLRRQARGAARWCAYAQSASYLRVFRGLPFPNPSRQCGDLSGRL